MAISVYFNYDWEYWESYEKVTIDGPNKLILVNYGVTELDWRGDVYSAWKRWEQFINHQENMGFVQAMRSTGGDYITQDGLRRVGATYFLMNGWRLRTWSGSHRLIINGNVYTEEGEPIYVQHIGNYGVVIEQTLSSLVDTVYIDGSEPVEPVVVPTAMEIAAAVWNKMTAAHLTAGTFGNMVNTIKATGDLNFAQIAVANTKLDTVTALIETLMKYEMNRTKIDQTAKTLTVYDNDGITPIRVFDLKNFIGVNSITEIAERDPQ